MKKNLGNREYNNCGQYFMCFKRVGRYYWDRHIWQSIGEKFRNREKGIYVYEIDTQYFLNKLALLPLITLEGC